MKNIDPLQIEHRRAKRLKKLGSAHPLCLYCGCEEPMLLRPVTRKFLELHHPFGFANDPATTFALCFNCHALAHEKLLQAGVSLEQESNPRNVLRAMAVHYSQMSDAAFRFADLANKHIENIEERIPRWNGDLIVLMCKRAWPIWKVCRSKVPRRILKNLDEDGDWPRGTAAAIMQRLNKDDLLRLEVQRQKY